LDTGGLQADDVSWASRAAESASVKPLMTITGAIKDIVVAAKSKLVGLKIYLIIFSFYVDLIRVFMNNSTHRSTDFQEKRWTRATMVK